MIEETHNICNGWEDPTLGGGDYIVYSGISIVSQPETEAIVANSFDFCTYYISFLAMIWDLSVKRHYPLTNSYIPTYIA